MDDFLGVKVLHAAGNLSCPAHHLGRKDLGLLADVIVERPLRAELHHYTVARRFGAHATVCACVRAY